MLLTILHLNLVFPDAAADAKEGKDGLENLVEKLESRLREMELRLEETEKRMEKEKKSHSFVTFRLFSSLPGSLKYSHLPKLLHLNPSW